MTIGFFTVLEGDFVKGTDKGRIAGKHLLMKTKGKFFRERINTSEIAAVEVSSTENRKSFGGAAVAGLAGSFLLGPVGAVAGILAGGNTSTVTFTLRLRDGRRCFCTAKPKVLRMIQAAAF